MNVFLRVRMVSEMVNLAPSICRTGSGSSGCRSLYRAFSKCQWSKRNFQFFHIFRPLSNAENGILFVCHNKFARLDKGTIVHSSETQNQIRNICTSGFLLKERLSNTDLKKAMDQLSEQFMEARELIDDARESMETVYFSEDMSEAQEAVKATLDQYQKLLDRLSEDQRQEVLRTIGLRMEELKAQEQAIKDALHDSH